VKAVKDRDLAVAVVVVLRTIMHGKREREKNKKQQLDLGEKAKVGTHDTIP
jgi:hypothetical protein